MAGLFIFVVSVFIALFPNILLAREPASATDENACVIILHGIARTKWSMSKLDKYLAERGYKTVNLDYPSTSEPIEQIAEKYVSRAVAQCKDAQADTIHFVTHSMGGIVVRQYLQSNSLPKRSRLVMLSPPNQGSEVVDYLREFFLYKWVTGPAGQQLGTDTESLPKRLKPVDIEVGVITGDKSFNPWFSSLVSGPDDGTVSVEGARLKEMTDFIVVDNTHTFIMRDSFVLQQVFHFLRYGKFNRR
jgi:triacylglycerol lipase